LFGVTDTGDRLRPNWWLVALVVSIGPFVLWRVHALREDPPVAVAAAVDIDPAPEETDPAHEEEDEEDEEETSREEPVDPGELCGSGAGGPAGSGPVDDGGNHPGATGGTTGGSGTGSPAPTAPGNTAAGTGDPSGGNPPVPERHSPARRTRRTVKKGGSRSRAGAGRDELRDRVRERITALIADGKTPSPAALGREYDADPEWVRNQIRAVRKTTE